MNSDDDTITVSTTSLNTAEATPIVLRDTSTTRLVFRPTLLEENQRDANAVVGGDFVFQRRRPGEAWEDVEHILLNKLKAGEGVRLELRSGEILKLFQGLQSYYALVGEYGIGSGTSQFMKAPRSQVLRDLAQDESVLTEGLKDAATAVALLKAFVRWVASNEQAVSAVQFQGVSASDLSQFDAVLALAYLEKLCQELDQNAANGDESYWQRILEQFSWAIAQVYAFPLMIVRGQVYVGGKHLDNASGNTADFLYRNGVSGNVVIVEIKTPATPIVGPMYRNNVHSISGDLVSATVQLLNAKQSLIENYRTLASDELRSPRGLLIIGDLNLSPAEIRSFELYRNNQRDIDIVTFDELRAKVQLMVDLLHKAGC